MKRHHFFCCNMSAFENVSSYVRQKKTMNLLMFHTVIILLDWILRLNLTCRFRRSVNFNYVTLAITPEPPLAFEGQIFVVVVIWWNNDYKSSRE